MTSTHWFVWLTAILLLASCGNMPTPTSQVAIPYLSSAQYEHLDCPALNLEIDKLNHLVQEFSIAQEDRVKDSKGHALYYGWGSGDGMGTIELAKVQGERNAVRRVYDKKECAVIGKEVNQ